MESQKLNGGDIKIRVKSASHRCEDITITCNLSNSVKRVKEIIKEHYPLHPETEEQRLIYAGQLLEDQQILNDIFNQSGQSPVAGGFTVHLACNSTFLRKANKAMNDEKKLTEESQSTAPPYSPPTPGMPTPIPTAGVPQDILALHSLYVQQMMHFMAQWGPGNGNIPMQGSWGPVPSPQFATGFNQFNYIPPNNLQQRQFAPFQNNPPAAAQPEVNQPVVAPRVVVRNEDDEHPRDLLDWMYTLSRILLILSVVYFYSNLTRFILVIIFTALVFVFQRRANLRDQEQAGQRNRLAAQAAVQPEPHVPAAAVPQPQENATQTEPVVGNPSEPTPVDDIIPEAQAQQQQQAQRFHLLDISRTFLTTFFTSLIPEMHPN